MENTHASSTIIDDFETVVDDIETFDVIVMVRYILFSIL